MTDGAGVIGEMMEWSIRPFREGDEAIMAVTTTANFMADDLKIVVGAEEMRSDLKRMGVDLESGTLIVDGPRVEGLPDEVLAGYGLLGVREDEAKDERIYGFRISVHPV